MSKIEFLQISEDEIEVTIPTNTPIEMVQQLTKSFISRGLFEDMQKSTLGTRYFYRPSEDTADRLIKSLERLVKNDQLPYWHPKSQIANQKRIRTEDVAARQAKVGVTPTLTPSSTPKTPSPAATTAAAAHTPASYTAPHGKMFDNTSAAMRTADSTGKRYAYITDPVKKEEDKDEIEKSNYGPKGGGQYSAADNAKRKMSNTGDVVDAGKNVNVKSYSTKPGQMSSKEQSNLTSRIQAAANKKQPVKQWTPEQIAEENQKRGLKKGWGDHLPFPSAEEEIMRLAKDNSVSGENAAANQLLKLMAGKSMLGTQPPPQPTDEEMFGAGVVTDEMAKTAENKWNNTFNSWLSEAAKPIGQRFASEEEERAYWANIKVSDRDDGQSGY